MRSLVKNVLLGVFGALLVVVGAGWTANSLELSAPGGGEMDLDKNLAQYYGTNDQPVKAHWNNLRLQTDYLEYHHLKELVKAKGQVELVQEVPVQQRLTCLELEVDLAQERMIASGEIMAQLDEGTTVFGGYLQWERGRDWVQVLREPRVEYQEWTISGDVVEGHPERGLWTISGRVVGVSEDTIVKAGKLIADRQGEVFYLQENPVVIRGQNEVTAPEIIYNLKTKKVLAKGLMRSRLIN